MASIDGNEYIVITRKARKKILKARAGDITLPKITKMELGSGGCDAEGNAKKPTEDQEELVEEIIRKDVDGHSYIDDFTCRYTCKLTQEECAGKFISEMALIDADGDAVAIMNCMKKGKDGYIEMTFTLDDIF